MTSVRRILCATDWSACSDRAYAHAIHLARTFGAAVHLVHVHPMSSHMMPDASRISVHAALMYRAHRELKKALAALAASASGVEVTSELLEGVPHEEIVRCARELPADLVVIGTRGRTGLQRLLLGSVAEQVVRASPVPVMTVPPDADAENARPPA